MACLRRPVSGQDGGVALVLVIWVIVVLIAIVGEFSYSMRTEINITRNFKEEEQAYQLALAGIETAKAEIMLTADISRMYLNDDGVLVLDPDKDLPERKETLGNGKFEYTVTDEDGKMNLNTETPIHLRNLLTNAGLETEDIDTIADSIMDWRDPDDLHMLNGAEDDYYESLEVPYSSKDANFDSALELLLVKGVTKDIFFGTKPDVQDDKEEKPAYDGIGKYFTVYGSGQINVRSAPRAVLEAIWGPDYANNTMALRAEGVAVPAMQGAKVTSDYFTIVSTGYNMDGTIKRTVKTVLQRSEDILDTVYWNDNYIE